MADSPPASRLALPALLVANFALACGPWLVRLARSEGGVGPVSAGFWRLILALPILGIAAWRIERRPIRLGRAEGIMVVGGLAFAADLATWHIGILHTRLANSTLFGNVTAILFPLYGFFVARSWPRPRQWTALAIALLGVALLLGRSFELSTANVWGDLACITAGLFYLVYLIAADRVRGTMPPLTTLFVSTLAGIPLLLVSALAMGEQIWPQVWAPLILLTLGSQIVGQGLILFSVARLPPIVVGLMLLVQPIVSAAIGWWAYGEHLTPADAIGAIAIVAAVALVRDSRRGTARSARLPGAAPAPSSAA